MDVLLDPSSTLGLSQPAQVEAAAEEDENGMFRATNSSSGSSSTRVSFAFLVQGSFYALGCFPEGWCLHDVTPHPHPHPMLGYSPAFCCR